MAQNRHTPIEVQKKLKDAAKLIDRGLSPAKVCDHLGVSRSTFYRWRRKKALPVISEEVSQNFNHGRGKIIYYPIRHEKRPRNLSLAEALGMSESELKIRQEAIVRQKEAEEHRKRT